MKYKDLDDNKWQWLKDAILKRDQISVKINGERNVLTTIQVCGLFITKNHKLGVCSIQGNTFFEPKPNQYTGVRYENKNC